MTHSEVLGFLVLPASLLLALTSRSLCMWFSLAAPCKEFASAPLVFAGHVIDIPPIVINGGSLFSQYRQEQRPVHLEARKLSEDWTEKSSKS